MDAIDRKILSLVQDDGRASVTDVAAQVGLSLSSCHRRMKELTATGAIERYRAVISPEKIGLGFEALVFVTMSVTDLGVIAEFEDAIAAEPNIVTAQRLFGQPDYMLRVLTQDMGAYQELYDTKLAALPGVQRLTSTMVMKRIGVDGTIPV